MATIDPNTPIWQLTVAELSEVIHNAFAPPPPPEPKPQREFVKGIQGLARILNISVGYAQRLKSKGIFDTAIEQNQRTIHIDVEQARECYNNRKI